MGRSRGGIPKPGSAQCQHCGHRESVFFHLDWVMRAPGESLGARVVCTV